MKNDKTELWAETLAHINDTWAKKKNRKYPFTGQELKLLKQLRRWYTAPEVWALWTCYLLRSPYWGARTGYLIGGFWQERSILLEDSDFKRLVAQYETQIGLKEPKQVAQEFGLVAKAP